VRQNNCSTSVAGVPALPPQQWCQVHQLYSSQAALRASTSLPLDLALKDLLPG